VSPGPAGFGYPRPGAREAIRARSRASSEAGFCRGRFRRCCSSGSIWRGRTATSPVWSHSDPDGTVADAGWTQTLAATVAWVSSVAPLDALSFVDAPLLVENESGQRLCEKQVGQRYWRWQMSAHSSNRSSPHLAGVRLREHLEQEGWTYSDGLDGPTRGGRIVSECYPKHDHRRCRSAWLRRRTSALQTCTQEDHGQRLSAHAGAGV